MGEWRGANTAIAEGFDGVAQAALEKVTKSATVCQVVKDVLKKADEVRTAFLKARHQDLKEATDALKPIAPGDSIEQVMEGKCEGRRQDQAALATCALFDV